MVERIWSRKRIAPPGGKVQLAAEAVALAGQRDRELLRAGLADSHPADFVEGWAELTATELESSGWADGCPVATTALETAHTSARLAGAYATAFAGWQSAIADAIVARGLVDADADADADRLATRCSRPSKAACCWLAPTGMAHRCERLVIS